MPEKGYVIDQNPAKEDSVSTAVYFQSGRQESLYVPASHEERLEWVRKSCERFFEKVREFDALVVRPELN